MFLPATNILKFSKIVHIINLLLLVLLLFSIYFFIYGTIIIVEWQDIKQESIA